MLFGVVSVTVRVSPAGSAGGSLVGQPVATIGDEPGSVDEAAPLGVVDEGLNTTKATIRTTTVITPVTSQGRPGNRLAVAAPLTGWVGVDDAGVRPDCWAPRRRLPLD